MFVYKLINIVDAVWDDSIQEYIVATVMNKQGDIFTILVCHHNGEGSFTGTQEQMESVDRIFCCCPVQAHDYLPAHLAEKVMGDWTVPTTCEWFNSSKGEGLRFFPES